MKRIFCLLALLLIFSACRKENNAREFKGTYEGTYRIKANGIFLIEDSKILLSSPNFTVLKGSKLGSGTFNVDSKMEVSFRDTNVWTADFDWTILLDGTYTYQALGDSLILTKYTGQQKQNYYEYRLKRISK